MSRSPRPARLRLRRRLLLMSSPAAVVGVLVAVKLISVVVVGVSAQDHYRAGAIDGLRGDVSILGTLNVVEPANAPFAAGGLAVLQGRLDVAEREFAASLARTDAAESCPVRINLALVKERQGDIDGWEARLGLARDSYDSALATIAESPSGCFEGNEDPDPERRLVRQDAAERIAAKRRALGTAAPPPPPPPLVAAGAPPVEAAGPAPEPTDPSQPRRLDPTGGDPLDALRRLLRDAAGS